MKTVLVTGGCGYIGSHTVVELLTNNIEVISIDNFSNSKSQVISAIEKITKKSFTNYSIDIRELTDIESIFKKHPQIDGIIHFAAKKYVNESIKIPLEYYNTNVCGLVNILTCCKKYHVQHFVFSSSCSVYGNAKKLPVSEASPLAASESPYAETKVMGERIILDSTKAFSLKATLLRYFNPAGAHISGLIGENPKQVPLNIVPRITGTALGKYNEFDIMGKDYPTRDGTCIRDYVHVSDIANAHVLALKWLFNEENASLCEIFNLGTGKGVSVLEMVKAFEKATHQSLPYSFKNRRYGDVIAIYANNEKAKSLLNWKPKYNLTDMMLTAWNWDKKLNS